MRALHEIADEIVLSWPEPYFGAVPYIHVMRRLEKVTDLPGMDDGAEIVQRFLSNAKTWRGDTARRIKTELRETIR